MNANRFWPGAIAGLLLLATAALMTQPRSAIAQSPSSLSDEQMLSLVLPPLADGSRPGVHLWARADQAVGPSGLPTVFVVTLYTKQTATGPEEHEVVNYLQYSNGGWAPARPRDDGTLLIDDWAWISLNLTNLTAVASGQGNASQYTVDYTSSGNYAGTPRQLVVEEVYGADLVLRSSAVLTDSAGPGGVAAPNPGVGASNTAATPPFAATPAAANAITTSPAPVQPIVTAAPAAPASNVVVPPVTTPAAAPPALLNPSNQPATATPARPGLPTP
jgi:hypothetical protein